MTLFLILLFQALGSREFSGLATRSLLAANILPRIGEICPKPLGAQLRSSLTLGGEQSSRKRSRTISATVWVAFEDCISCAHLIDKGTDVLFLDMVHAWQETRQGCTMQRGLRGGPWRCIGPEEACLVRMATPMRPYPATGLYKCT